MTDEGEAARPGLESLQRLMQSATLPATNAAQMLVRRPGCGGSRSAARCSACLASLGLLLQPAH